MLRIRPAIVSDAEAMCRVHFAAVHQTAAKFYSAALIEAWSSAPEEGRYQQFRRAIASQDESFLVAESADEVVGFGSVVVSLQVLRSLYVHPRAGRLGFGGRLTAALNAEQFYLHHGYEVLGRGLHRSSTGVEMACVHMNKDRLGKPSE
jgi:L-amino acid N-acyltransferase YncA